LAAIHTHGTIAIDKPKKAVRHFPKAGERGL
jgi:hypothetical protein